MTLFTSLQNMDWTSVLKFIRPELFILVFFIFAIGLFLKKVPWFKDEWKIPMVLWLVAMLFAILYLAFVLSNGLTMSILLSGIVQGTLIAALAVFGNENIKQYITKRPEDKKTGGV